MADSNSKQVLLTTSPEKPNHYTYLKEFRVEQCQSFLQHKCNQHRPFICFNWHFMNQRRRRPVRKRDGTFNYSADNYCVKYDGTTGVCADGDECPFLHRTAGDTERRYHLRYYKTCMCVHDTDARGYCVKNGHHCAFAHGLHDQRPAVYDIKEIESSQTVETNGDLINVPNALDKERNLMNEDPKWQDTNHVLTNYKTEPCKRPPRLCRQGYACPQYHNSKDKRRSPRKFTYRCPFLHRTAGDTERRYHLRYYKTCMCVHDTDARGYCVKNGHHCAFAHGLHDQRPAVYDIKEIESSQTVETNGDLINVPNALDKERNLMNEDPKWQDTNHVLTNYKTEPCKRPPRLCRQGYACPQYHNSKDKRRSPRKFTYRSTPCPNVKHGEEWGEPANCEAGDNCQYCHTRTEQQFHPEIYKSTKCNDVQQAGYCPRSVFCAFAHVEQEVPPRELDGPSANLALGDIISNVLPLDGKKDKHLGSDSNNMLNGSGESCESASTSSVGSNHSHSKAPGAQLQQKHNLYQNNLNGNCNQSSANGQISNAMNPFPDFNPDLTKQLLSIENDPTIGPLEKEQRKRMCMTFIGSMGKYSNLTDDLARRDLSHLENSISAGFASTGLLQNTSQPVNIPNSMSNSISGILQNTSAPVNIPGSSLSNFSPNNHSHMFSITDPFSHISGSAPKINNSFGHSDNLFYQSHLISPGLEALSISPELRISEINSLRDELTNSNSVGNSLFENSLQHSKPFSMSPSIMNNPSINEMTRLREEYAQKLRFEDRISIIQATQACEAWKTAVDESNRKVALAEEQRDEALNRVQILTEKFDQLSTQNSSSFPRGDLRGLSLQKLKGLQAKLRSDLEEVEKVLYSETATKCMNCEENNRSVTLVPCNHYVLCDVCAATVRECPYCQTVVTSQA